QTRAGDVGLRYEPGGSLCSVYSPQRVGKDLENPSVKGFEFKGFDPAPGLTTGRLYERSRLLQQVDRSKSATSSTLRDFQSKALELVTGPEARQAFDLSKEPEKIRERYGWHPLGQNLLM